METARIPRTFEEVLDWPAERPSLNHPTDIECADGYVFISDHNNNRVVKGLADGSDWHVIAASPLDRPDGIAIDSDGYLYVSDFYNNVVRVRSRQAQTPTPTSRWTY